jgi:uncharacterized membrane protein YesL
MLGKGHWLDSANHWSTPIVANMAWVVLSLPFVTLPLATIGLFGVIFRWTVGQNISFFSVFFGTIRRNWLKSYLVFAVDLVIGGLVFINFRVFQLMDMTTVLSFLSLSITIFVALQLVMVNVYIWPLLAVWDRPLKEVVKFAFQLVFVRPLWAIIISVGVVASFVAAAFLPALVFITVAGAFTSYIACRGAWFIVRHYIDPQDFAWIEFD